MSGPESTRMPSYASKTSPITTGLNSKTYYYPILVSGASFLQASQTARGGAMGRQAVLRDWMSTWMKATIAIELTPRERFRWTSWDSLSLFL